MRGLRRTCSAHENSLQFEEYKAKLRPLVDGETGLFGNAVPFAALGYEA